MKAMQHFGSLSSKMHRTSYHSSGDKLMQQQILHELTLPEMVKCWTCHACRDVLILSAF